ncbi:MAG: hypothetical protein Q3971_06275 [Moraxella sp.]|nr:hypothetical protein [Moraxella sp.]
MSELSTKPTPQKELTTLSRGFLNVLLVFLESAITLVLRFDPNLRKLAYPLANKDIVVCIRTYLPHTQIYATFGFRGVLLDDCLPPNKTHADILVNAYSFQLLNVLKSHSQSAVEALQIRGEQADVAEFKAFLVQLGIGGVIHNLLQKFKGDPAPTPQEREQKQENYKAKIATLESELSQASTENARLKTALAEMTSKQQSTKIALIVMSVIAFVAVVSHLFR